MERATAVRRPQTPNSPAEALDSYGRVVSAVLSPLDEVVSLRERLADLEASIEAEQVLRKHMIETLSAKGLDLDADLVEAGSLMIAADLENRRREVAEAIEFLAAGQHLDAAHAAEVDAALKPRPQLSSLDEGADTIESLEDYLLSRDDLTLL
jgi:hypothetical protein